MVPAVEYENANNDLYNNYEATDSVFFLESLTILVSHLADSFSCELYLLIMV